MRESLTQAKRWVVKIGSALLTTNGKGLDKQHIKAWAEQIVALRQQGMEIVIVSSGAVAEGMARLNMSARPKHLHELQAAAAVGQMGLIEAYEASFHEHGLHAAQVLLTHDDLSNRKRYLNARSTIRALLDLNVIPIINENDTVVTDEIRFGDNDTLAALVANLVEADHLVILTDQDGLYDKNPRKHTDAKLVQEANVDDASLDAMVDGAGSHLGQGGMLTKLSAARLAARSGASTLIAAGDQAGILLSLRQGEQIGSLINASTSRATAHKQWLAGHLQMRGRLVLDDGAVKVLREKGSSLLAVGVTAVEGNFMRGEVVACVDQHQREIARGLVNYSAGEIDKITGQTSAAIEKILGYIDEEEVIHRDNLVLV